MSQVPSHISALNLTLLPHKQAIVSGSEFPISELSEVNFAERKIEAVNPLNPETAVKSKQRKPRKMSQIVSEEVAPVVAPAKKIRVSLKNSKKMMMTESPVIPEKIETDFQSSAGGTVSEQASQMSQEYNQYGSIDVFAENLSIEVAPEVVVPEVKKITTIKPRAKKSKVSFAPAPVREEEPVVVVQEVAELLAEMVERAYAEELKAEKKRKTAEKAKATREANKAKKLALVAEVAEVADSEDEEGNGKDEGEYEVSTKKRPIQKSKEGRVLKGRISAVEKKVKKELKILKTPLGQVLKKIKNAEEIEEKREEFIQEKKSAISRVHHAIAEEFNTSVVVARRSEEGRGEKVRKPIKLKEKTASKLFWANCFRVLPHFVENFTTFTEAKKTYAEIEKWCFAEEDTPEFTIAKRREAYGKFRAIFQRATKALVSDNCQHQMFYAEVGVKYPSLILANHLSAQGIYVVKRTENSLVLRSSRDELIEIGNSNEVMSRDDLVFNEQTKLVQAVGHNVLRRLCGAISKNVAESVFGQSENAENEGL